MCSIVHKESGRVDDHVYGVRVHGPAGVRVGLPRQQRISSPQSRTSHSAFTGQ